MRKRIFYFINLLFLLTSFTLDSAPKQRILVGSPVRQKPDVLREFLESLNTLDRSSYITDYFFIDDNDSEESRQLLQQFAKQQKNRCHIVQANKASETDPFICDETTHHWNINLMDKVGSFKDTIIQDAREKQYDYLFLIDSDIVLHPKTITQLISTNRDIISNIFWTSWQPNLLFLPQVWLQNEYGQYKREPDEQLSAKEIKERMMAFLTKMRTPGTYEVGGLGACTLINKNALQKEISFKRIKNLSFKGEDRHFCVRAVALGLDLHVDTHFPAYHIYRESDLANIEDFKRSWKAQKKQNSPRITLSMIMKDEASRYLRPMLEDAKRYITDAVIIDDNSTDSSVALCEEILKGIPYKIIKNKESKFSNEIELRTQQWKETIKTNPDWIVFLDADEIFEDQFAQEVKQLVKSPDIDMYFFRLYDFWNTNHYREDTHWQAHSIYRPFLIRYRPDIPYAWDRKTPQHCGRMPSVATKLLGKTSELRLKHYGWAKEHDRIRKYHRFLILDPEAKYGNQEQYNTILDESPTLIKWVE